MNHVAVGISLTQVAVTVPVAILDHDHARSVNWKLKVSVPQKSAFGV